MSTEGDQFANKSEVGDLGSYVRRLMKLKGLSLRDVERRSRKGITQAYVGAIVRGSHTNLSVAKLKALSVGLGVDEEELFTMARGSPPRRTAAPGGIELDEFLELARALAATPLLIQLLRGALELSPSAQAVLLRTLEMLSAVETREQTRRRSM